VHPQIQKQGKAAKMEQMVRQLAAKAAAFNKVNYFSGGGMRKGKDQIPANSIGKYPQP